MPRSPRRALTAPSEPRHAAWLAGIVYLVATLALAYPALAGGFLVNPNSDQYLAGYAFRHFGAEMLRHTGHFPLWNPYVMGGVPYVAAMAGDIFYPTFLLRMILPTDVAMTWGFIIHIVLAGWFTYFFLRALRFGFWPALTGGLAYMMGGPISSYVSPGHDGKLFVSALMPLALWMLVRGIRDGRAWAWGVFALTVGLAVLSPHPQLLQYMLLLSGAFGLWLAFAGEGDAKLPREVALRRLGLAMAGVMAGLLMGAIQFLPVFRYVPWSPRAGGLHGWDLAISYSFPPEELINTVVPQFTGILGRYWGRNGIHFHSEYLGVVVFALAGLGLAYVRRGERQRLARFWLVTMGVALLWSLGGYTPFYRLVYAIVPGTKYFRAPSTMFFVVGFALAIFAAFGVERLERREVSRRYAAGWFIAAVALIVLGVSGALTAMAEGLALPGRLEMVDANATPLAIGAVRSALFMAAAAGVLYALALDRLRAVTGIAVLLALAATDLWSIERMYWQFSAPASQLYASDATIRYMQQQKEPGRVLALPLAPLTAYHDPFFLGDALMTHHIRQVLGYHGNELGRYDELVDKNNGYRDVVNPQVWRLLNVRYLLTNVAQLPLKGAPLLAGPVVNAAGDTSYLYGVPEDNPPAWVAPVIVKAPDQAVLATVLDARFDPRRAALFDTSAAVTGEQVTALPPPSPVSASVTRYDPGHITLDLSEPAPHGSALVVSENYYPGWTATVDGKPAAIGRADFVLIGVALPEGARHVDLAFSSTPYQHGKLITLVTLLAVLAAIAAGVVLDRKGARG